MLTDPAIEYRINIVTKWSLYFNSNGDRVVTKGGGIYADENIYRA